MVAENSINGGKSDKKGEPEIANVWSYNLKPEIKKISLFIENYRYIAFNVEYPGIAVRPIDSFKDFNDHRYSIVCTNANLLKIIQLSLTFFDSGGALKPGTSTWKFNFSFDPNEDIYAADSLLFLQSKLKTDFDKHRLNGIAPVDFAELAIPSGLVLNDDIKWVCFHGAYDFAFLLKTMLNLPLPAARVEFFKLLKSYFGDFYDVKSILSGERRLAGVPLVQLARELAAEDELSPGKQKKVKSEGEKEAGAAGENKETEKEPRNLSRVTGEAFFAAKERLAFDEETSGLKSALYGLGEEDAAKYFKERSMCYIKGEIKSEIM